MYTLRKITENQVSNFALGNCYSLVNKELNEKEFEHYYQSVFDNPVPKDNNDIISFVLADTVHPICSHEMVYIMTESGRTFECINKPKN